MFSYSCRSLIALMTFVGLSAQAQYKCLDLIETKALALAETKALSLTETKALALTETPAIPANREIQGQVGFDPNVYNPAANPISPTLTQDLETAIKNPARVRVKLGAGIEVNGKLSEYLILQGKAAYVRFTKETKISELFVNAPAGYSREIPNQGDNFHKEGFGTAIGDFTMRKLEPVTQVAGLSSRLKNLDAYFRELGPKDKPTSLDFVKNRVSLDFDSGVRVVGKLMKVIKHSQTKKIAILTFVECTVTYTDPNTQEVKTLFAPSYGVYDLVVAPEISQIQ